MRLINIAPMELEGFVSDIPYYAILSHLWEIEEVSIQDFVSGNGKELEGWAKIPGCCEQARNDGWQYVVGSFFDSCSEFRRFNADLVL